MPIPDDLPRTTADHIMRLASLEELEGFAAEVRKPNRKPMTEADWALLARRRIEFQRGSA